MPRTARGAHGSWLGFVKAMSDLDAQESAAFERTRVFLEALDSTRMARSFKMLVLLAMLNTDTLPGQGIGIDALTAEFARLAGRTPKLVGDVGVPLDDAGALTAMIERNPIDAWTGASAVPALASEEPVLLASPRGSAKSAILNRIAAALRLELRYYNASRVSVEVLPGFLPLLHDERRVQGGLDATGLAIGNNAGIMSAFLPMGGHAYSSHNGGAHSGNGLSIRGPHPPHARIDRASAGRNCADRAPLGSP